MNALHTPKVTGLVWLALRLSLGFPATTIVDWAELVDYPDPGEHDALGLQYTYDWDSDPFQTRVDCPKLDLAVEGIEDEELAEKISDAAAGDKLVGWPQWIQGAEYPVCPRCSRQMILVFQLDSNDHLPFMFGDMGTGHVTQCPTHKDIVAFGWAYS